MREIEIKFRVKDFRRVREKLIRLGARLDWKGLEQSWFFDTPKQHLKAQHYNLRLRSWQGHSHTLTVKTKPAEEDRKYKVRNEYQIVVDNIQTTAKILKLLGFKEYLHYRKDREHWLLKDAAVELDKLKGQHFVEIEAPKKRIDELATLLGLDWKKAEKRGYVSILRGS